MGELCERIVLPSWDAAVAAPAPRMHTIYTRDVRSSDYAIYSRSDYRP